MELTPRQQKLVFVVIVVGLVGLGTYLVLSNTSHPGRPVSTAAANPTDGAPAAVVPTQAPTQPAATAPGAPGAVNIYQWLPFTQDDLGQASNVAIRFSGYYDTYRYDENANAYVGRMQGLVASQLSQKLAGAYATLGVAQQRRQDKQISTGNASINSLRSFGPASLTFLVTIDESLSSVKGTTQTSNQYAVTVTKSSVTWEVYDIEPASAGNQ